MEAEQIILWFWTIVSSIYGLLIGSFLNVVIYRLPPKIYYFDDVFFSEKPFDLFADISLLWRSIFKDKKKQELQLEPSLYVESIWLASVIPESVITGVFAHNFNLYRFHSKDNLSISNPPRSFCPKCGNMIKWWMNIPVFSWIFLGARCYYCKSKISFRYPLNELLSGIFCGALFYMYGMENLPLFIFTYALAAISIAIFYIDLDNWLILDEITLPFTFLAIVGSVLIPTSFFMPVPYADIIGFFTNPLAPVEHNFNFQQGFGLYPQSIIHSFAGAVFGYVFFWAIAVIGKFIAKRDAMGAGDLKLAMMMGAFLGIQKAMLAFILSVFSGTLIMLPLMLIGRKTGKDQVPFGCFLSLATVITVFFGERLINLYINYMGIAFLFKNICLGSVFQITCKILQIY